MRRTAIFFLGALGLAGWVGADAAGRSHGGDAAEHAGGVLRGDVVVQRSAASADVVLAVDGGTTGEPADGIADRVFVLQRDGSPAGEAVARYPGARVLVGDGSLVVVPRDGRPAVALSVAGDRTASEAASAFLAGTPVGDRWTGRGIAVRTGEVRLGAAGLSASEMERVLASCGSRTAGEGAGRTAGAPPCPGGGSTDCSNSTCQIFCAPGYTACCDCTPDPTNCRCSCVRM